MNKIKELRIINEYASGTDNKYWRIDTIFENNRQICLTFPLELTNISLAKGLIEFAKAVEKENGPTTQS